MKTGGWLWTDVGSLVVAVGPALRGASKRGCLSLRPGAASVVASSAHHLDITPTACHSLPKREMRHVT